MCRVISFKEAIKQACSTGITRAYPHMSICFNASIRIIPVIHMLAQTRRISRCPWRPLRGRAARASGERREWRGNPRQWICPGEARSGALQARHRRTRGGGAPPLAYIDAAPNSHVWSRGRRRMRLRVRVRKFDLGRPPGVHAVGSRSGRCGQRAHRVAAVPGLALGAGRLSTSGGCPTPAGRPSEASCRPRSGRTRCVLSTYHVCGASLSDSLRHQV